MGIVDSARLQSNSKLYSVYYINVGWCMCFSQRLVLLVVAKSLCNFCKKGDVMFVCMFCVWGEVISVTNCLQCIVYLVFSSSYFFWLYWALLADSLPL